MIAYLFLLSFVVLPVDSQDAKMPVQPRAEFEVASIKPSGSSGHIGCSVYPGGRVDIGHLTLQMIIEYAFDVQPFQVSGGRGWTRDRQYRYDIGGKATIHIEIEPIKSVI